LNLQHESGPAGSYAPCCAAECWTGAYSKRASQRRNVHLRWLKLSIDAGSPPSGSQWSDDLRDVVFGWYAHLARFEITPGRGDNFYDTVLRRQFDDRPQFEAPSEGRTDGHFPGHLPSVLDYHSDRWRSRRMRPSDRSKPTRMKPLLLAAGNSICAHLRSRHEGLKRYMLGREHSLASQSQTSRNLGDRNAELGKKLAT
jgi:hypothetical protein